MNNNHSNSNSNHKNETRLAHPTSKQNSVAPMSDPTKDTMNIINEKDLGLVYANPSATTISPVSDDENKLFVKRSDKGATVSENGHTENSSNTHLLKLNSESINV